ncbi:uncharacterized protein KY384_008314 [Bacidia gigantensis]|uniref:uncharacterized protein n=1 Tax=Bacidia gigantensis TaxID=2732470 RepID=UPI001D0402CB|nr:uncharacterized protein KY384_008314 [Bacidia gigantensis]KAG8526885.1 hypothetical protein KY384_008314 [Bacidia gigantensis]
MAPVVHKRGPWGPQEDQTLLGCVACGGPQNWVRISAIVGTRTPKQCRERYHQNLKPALNHAPITAEEGALIEKLVGQIGKRWAEIARRLPGRSDNAVKNWYNGGVNRRKRMVVRRETAGRSAAHDSAHRRQQLSLHRTPPESLQSHQQLSTFSGQSPEGAQMISPTRSDISMADSVGEAPSLVSDNGSQRTVTSPPSIPTRSATRTLRHTIH